MWASVHTELMRDWPRRLEVVFGLCLLAGFAIGFVAGYDHPAVHSPVIVASTSLLVVGIGGLLSLRVPRWSLALRGRSVERGWTDRLGAVFGLCALVGVVILGVAEFVQVPTRRYLNVVAVIILALGLGGWAVLRAPAFWRRLWESPKPDKCNG
jgi:hypothetical protein